MQAADTPPRDVVLRQVAPGRYETTLVADASIPLKVTLAEAGHGDSGGVGSRVVLPDPAAEYRFGPPDEERLRAIATATGGAWRPGPEALASVSGDRRSTGGRSGPSWLLQRWDSGSWMCSCGASGCSNHPSRGDGDRTVVASAFRRKDGKGGS